MAGSDSIFEFKKDFIESQVRLLGGELRPPKNWQDEVPVTEEGDLSGKVVEQVLAKLNTIARKHNRLVYSSQALRHVAEQIDVLYREAETGEPGGMDGSREHDLLRRGVDLMDVDVIESLPDEYPGKPGIDSEEDLERYQTLRGRLVNAAVSLRAQQQRREYYSNLKELLEPFRDPTRSVQPNLVTRGGPLDQEMEKMRTLSLKLSVQIERAKDLVKSANEIDALKDIHDYGQPMEDVLINSSLTATR